MDSLFGSERGQSNLHCPVLRRALKNAVDLETFQVFFYSWVHQLVLFRKSLLDMSETINISGGTIVVAA